VLVLTAEPIACAREGASAWRVRYVKRGQGSTLSEGRGVVTRGPDGVLRLRDEGAEQRQYFLQMRARIERMEEDYRRTVIAFFQGDGDGEHSQCCPIAGDEP